MDDLPLSCLKCCHRRSVLTDLAQACKWGDVFSDGLRENDPVCMHGEIMYTVLTCISGSCSIVLLCSESGYNRKTSAQNLCREQNSWICWQLALYLLSIYIWEEYFKKTSATFKKIIVLKQHTYVLFLKQRTSCCRHQAAVELSVHRSRHCNHGICWWIHLGRGIQHRH